ncbi:MAG: hypothetical protein K9N35_12430 [Candidatus Marinimicrobia bacterium]|nr:hypothetical protein [Candidatus Neomarinimicrobiota bacterium]
MSYNYRLYTAFFLVLILSACSTNRFLSQPAPPEIRIDGFRKEWDGRFQTPKDQKFAVGISNDKNYLFLAITSMDRIIIRQFARQGVSIWVDIKGGQRENLGIVYSGMVPTRSRMPRFANNEGQDFDLNTPGEGMQDMIRIEGALDLIVSDHGSKRLGPSDLLATALSENGALFIEYQIPLALLGKDFKPEDGIRIGIKSGLNKETMGPRGSGDMPGGNRGGTSGGPSGGIRGGGGPRQGMQGQRIGMDNIETWIKVQLSPLP